MKCVLSIITITKNDPLGLKKTIDSLQPLLNSSLAWEHIIVDASLKENKDKIDDLPKNWPLRHIPNIPKGIYSAINQGLENSEGTYLLLLHGGDTLYSEQTLLENIKILQSNPEIDLLLSGARLLKKNVFQYPYIPPKKFLWCILGWNRICHQSLLYKRRFMNTVGLFSVDYPIAGDYEHHIRCFLKGAKYFYNPAPLVEYDLQGTSSNYKQAISEFKNIQHHFERQLPFYINIGNTILWWYEQKKIFLIKAISQSSIGSHIEPLWIWWKNK